MSMTMVKKTDSSIMHIKKQDRQRLRQNPENRMAKLTSAIQKGDAELVKEIIGLDTALSQLINALDSNGQAPIHNAAYFNQVEAVVLLIELGARINKRNSALDTPLHIACRFGRNDSASVLLNLGASVTAKSMSNKTALHHAAAGNHTKCIEMLISKGADVFAKTSSDNEFGNTALHAAAWNGMTGSVEVLLRARFYKEGLLETLNENRNTALHLASYAGHVEVVRILLDKGANMNERGRFGRLPIHMASVKGHANVVRLLLDRGAAISSKSGSKYPDVCQTPIHLAAFYGHINVIDVLLKDDASLLNSPCIADGQTPLQRAISNFRVSCVQGLLQRGADATVRDAFGQTSLILAKTAKPERVTFKQVGNRQRIIKILENHARELIPDIKITSIPALTTLGFVNVNEEHSDEDINFPQRSLMPSKTAKF